ncbi:hypothetical protein [Longimicrobium sp.]|uniref:hypothetical protein n=1 Tax=Longimicrobium sp. TaxID=2029185 RepID=UPI002CF6FB68|nr:hypothetical protein [Longimicrobium sp.]HSU16094.1 hypothetical protein [Longimicrobium sp.]
MTATLVKQGIREKIAALYAVRAPENEHSLGELIAMFRDNHAEAMRSFNRLVIGFVLVWILCYLISAGIIKEGEIASFKLSEISLLLLAGPPLLGALFYLVVATMVGAEILMNAISEDLRYRLPKAYEMDLEYLLSPPNAISVERYLERETNSQWMNTIRDWWMKSFLFFLFFGSLVGIFHAAFLAWNVHRFPWFVLLPSYGLGLLFWLRGMLLAYVGAEIANKNA